MADLVSMRERLSRALATAKNGREKAKELMTEVVGTVMGAATAAGLAILDEERGVIGEGDLTGIRVYKVGPVPASLLVGALGKGTAVMLIGDGMATVASDVGQAGIDIGTYMATRQMWAKHKQDQKK